MPKLPFLLLGGGVGRAGWRMRHENRMAGAAPPEEPKPAAAKENLESLMRVEPLAIEVGLGLVGLVEGGAGIAAAAAHLGASAGNSRTDSGTCCRRCA